MAHPVSRQMGHTVGFHPAERDVAMFLVTPDLPPRPADTGASSSVVLPLSRVELTRLIRDFSQSVVRVVASATPARACSVRGRVT